MNVLITRPAKSPLARLLLAHGAGAPMDSAFMNTMAEAIAAVGVEVVRFEFPYMIARRQGRRKRPPDKQAVLLAHWDQQIQQFGGNDLPLFIGGKSMGGRMATLWAAEQSRAETHSLGKKISGVICFGYPFHPPGKPQQLRIAHLSKLPPLLIVQGERDKLGGREEVVDYSLSEKVQIEWIVAADHDLKPLVRSGITHATALASAAAAATQFILRESYGAVLQNDL